MKKENKKTKASAIDMTEENKIRQIEALRDTINSAEKTIQSAKAMLLNLEGKKKAGRRRKVDEEYAESNIIQGTFDGQIMVGTDGKQYPVPANYASKSKLVEGDMLKLTISSNGSFIYKQIGPAERKNIIGIIGQDENENYFVIAEGKPYRILLASITYFKIEPGDEVVIMIPREIEATWAAIENVLQKGHDTAMSMSRHIPNPEPISKNNFPADTELNSWKNDLKQNEPDPAKNNYEQKQLLTKDDFVDEWTSDIEELEKEIKAQQI